MPMKLLIVCCECGLKYSSTFCATPTISEQIDRIIAEAVSVGWTVQSDRPKLDRCPDCNKNG